MSSCMPRLQPGTNRSHARKFMPPACVACVPGLQKLQGAIVLYKTTTCRCATAPAFCFNLLLWFRLQSFNCAFCFCNRGSFDCFRHATMRKQQTQERMIFSPFLRWCQWIFRVTIARITEVTVKVFFNAGWLAAIVTKCCLRPSWSFKYIVFIIASICPVTMGHFFKCNHSDHIFCLHTKLLKLQ